VGISVELGVHLMTSMDETKSNSSFSYTKGQPCNDGVYLETVGVSIRLKVELSECYWKVANRASTHDLDGSRKQ
jgi:hypothetical protein